MQVISHHQVTTRKPHPCWGCAKTFPPKSTLWVLVSKDDEIERTYWCDRCQSIIDSGVIEPEECDGLMFGELADGCEVQS